jgi:hypothetical protein
MIGRIVTVCIGLLAFPAAMASASDALHVTTSNQSLWNLRVVPGGIGAIFAWGFTKLVHHRSPPVRRWRVHFYESGGAYVWLALGIAMYYGEGLTMNAGSSFACLALGEIGGNALALAIPVLAAPPPNGR